MILFEFFDIYASMFIEFLIIESKKGNVKGDLCSNLIYFVKLNSLRCTLESFGHHAAKNSNKSLTNHHTRSEAKFIPDFLKNPRKAYDK